jgi:GLPGLI family protein
MKKLLLILNLFSVISFGQNSSVEYSVIPNEKESKKDVLKTDAPIFTLEFNKNQSCFLEKSNEKETAPFLKNLPYFYFKNTNILFITNGAVLTQKNAVVLEWQMTNETKQIDNYTCYKALLEDIVVNKDNKVSTKMITAWYCLDLPFSYGPLNYNGLPGLVLELECDGYKYMAKNINITDNNMPIALSNLKIVTEEHYLKKPIVELTN